jgi:hypothetical protein
VFGSRKDGLDFLEFVGVAGDEGDGAGHVQEMCYGFVVWKEKLNSSEEHELGSDQDHVNTSPLNLTNQRDP